MDDLVAFLRARLDEDEAAARAASAGPWVQQVGYISGGPDGRVHVAQQAQAWNADHIARHDPARVLAEIDAKRRIVDLHAPARPRALPHREPGCLTCTTAQVWDTAAGEATCETLRLLALPYAGHPGYRETWHA